MAKQHRVAARPDRRAGRRARRRPETRKQEIPILPIVVGGVLAVMLIGLFVWYKVASGGPSPTNTQPIANVQCNSGEQLASHYHVHVDILYQGTPVPIPANTGIKSSCLYWLHTHDDSGVVHVEIPKDQAKNQFTLGQFFKIWGQPLSRHQVATITAGKGQQVKIWVDGKPYTGDPNAIVLKSHKTITIEIGPPFQDPPPTYTWDTSQYPQ